MRRSLLIAAILALTGCDWNFRPETLVENMRLIGVRATPADLHPGETAKLDALVLDPSRPGQQNSVLWIGCDPDPFNLNRSVCSDPDLVNDPAKLTGNTGELPPGVKIIGFNANAAYTASPTLFDALPAGDERRISGTAGQVILFAVAEQVAPNASEEELRALFDRVQKKEVRSVIAIFRIHLSESPERNTNPEVSGLIVGGERWPAGARVTVLPGEPVRLDLEAPDSTFEPFTNSTPSGVEQKTERVLTAWYSTTGRFSEERTALREDVTTVFTSPGVDPKDPIPERRTGTIYTVLRDTRGGQSWKEFPLFVCDASLAAPQVTGVTWPATESDPVVLSGNELASVLDVVVDGRALERGAFISARGTWEGFLPAGVPVGAKRGWFTSRTCARGPLP